MVVFELDTKKVTTTYTFKIKNYNEKSLVDIQSAYKDIILKPENVNKIKKEIKYKISDNLDFKNTILGKSKLAIDEYNISDKFNEVYNLCNNNVCRDIKYVVVPNNIGKKESSAIKFKTSLTLDDNLYMKKYINTPASFLEKYAYLEYNYLGEKQISDLKVIPVKYNQDQYAYLQADKNIEKADKIDLIILIRGIKYIINLK